MAVIGVFDQSIYTFAKIFADRVVGAVVFVPERIRDPFFDPQTFVLPILGLERS
jgi:hypothetical protein